MCLMLSRARPGGLYTPWDFSQICKKRNGGTPGRRFWHTFLYVLHMWRFQVPGCPRSGHQVTPWPHFRKKVSMLVIAGRSPWNFQRLVSVTVSIKCISRNFDIADLPGQFYDLSIISQWEEIERCLFWTKIIRNTLKHRVTGRTDTLNRNTATSDPSSCRRGHFRSWKVTSSFSAITFDSDKPERWKHHIGVQADDTVQLICNMTFSDQVVTLTWGQIFNMTF